MMSNSIEGSMNQQALDRVIQDTAARNRQSSVAGNEAKRRLASDPQEMGPVERNSAPGSKMVDQLANLKALGNVKLSISIDETKQLPVIKIFDDETGKELIQIPAEHALNISRTIKAAVGAIFDTKA